jgi:hypothetical protein
MVRQGKTEEEKTESCQGYEGSAKGRRRYGSCLNSIKMKVIITYRESASGAE